MKQQIIENLKRYKFHLGILLFFLIYMLFFDEYNWLRIKKDSEKLQNLTEEKAYLLKKIEEDRQQLSTLQNDEDALEKFAREEYLLKKDNEDIYIIQEEE